jgi:hypothetical protein
MLSKMYCIKIIGSLKKHRQEVSRNPKTVMRTTRKIEGAPEFIAGGWELLKGQ